MTIISFKGKYRFLSNFYPARVTYEDIEYSSVEVAYQASKAADKLDRDMIHDLPAAEAKRVGKIIEIRKDWEQVKVIIMKRLLIHKFSDKDLENKLLETGDSYIVEGNFWHDNFWGVCYCKECEGKGENVLGELLMAIRDNLERIKK